MDKLDKLAIIFGIYGIILGTILWTMTPYKLIVLGLIIAAAIVSFYAYLIVNVFPHEDA